MKHRKWIWDRYGSLLYADTLRTVEVSGLCMAHFNRGDGGAEALANARLISAAPDLFEALEAAMRELAMNGYRDDYGPMGLIISALAKAKGDDQ